MKIKSVTDVITNSSTEVFAMISQKSVEDLKNLINLLLKASGSSKTSDDLFDIHLIPSEYAEDEYYEQEQQPWEDLTREEQIDWCIRMAESDCYYHCFYPEVEIIPKSPDIPEDLVKLLGAVVNCGLTPVDATFG